MSDVLLHLLSLFRLFCFYDVKSSGSCHFKGIPTSPYLFIQSPPLLPSDPVHPHYF